MSQEPRNDNISLRSSAPAVLQTRYSIMATIILQRIFVELLILKCIVTVIFIIIHKKHMKTELFDDCGLQKLMHRKVFKESKDAQMIRSLLSI